MLAGVQSPFDHHCCCCRGSLARPRSPGLRGRRRGGCPRSSPATAARVTPRSSLARDDPNTSPGATPAATVELVLNLRRQLVTAGPRRRTRHDRLAPPPPPPDHRLAGDDLPASSPRRARHPGTDQEAAARPTSASKPNNPTRPGRPTSPTHRLADGSDVEILTWLDDHSRYALSVTAHRPVTGPARRHHLPRTRSPFMASPFSTLTDNGLVFTTRFAPAASTAATPSRPNSSSSASARRTRDPTIRPPAAKSNASNTP